MLNRKVVWGNLFKFNPISLDEYSTKTKSPISEVIVEQNKT